MSNTDVTKMQRFKAALDAYGADFATWPEGERDIADYVAENEQAAGFYAQAQALDRLLDLSAPAPDVAPSRALRERILGDFEALRPAAGGDVMAFPQDSTFPQDKTGKHQIARPQKRIQDGVWGMSAALAACFAMGLYLGGYGIGDWRLDPASSMASLSGVERPASDIGHNFINSGLEEELL